LIATLIGDTMSHKRVLLAELKEHIGSEVSVSGWISDLRNLNKIKFIILRDRTGDMQCIALKDSTPEEVFNEIGALLRESVVEVIGTVAKNTESKWGIELLIKKVNVINAPLETLPIDNSDKSNTELEKRIDYRFLDTRNKRVNAIFRVRSKIARILTDIFDDEGFTNINTPKIVPGGVESGAALFEVKYFDRKAYLAQSPQVYKQMFVTGGFERVYEFGVVFRAENSNTTRHLTEFTGVDFEMGFIKDFTDIMDIIELIFHRLLTELKKDCSKELELLKVDLNIPKDIPRMTMRDAKEYLKTKGRDYTAEDDLDPEGEKLLGEYAKHHFKSDFIFITHYPWAVRPFYTMRPEDDLESTKSFDLLFNGVEIATGSQREHRYDVLKKQSAEKGINLDEMPDYARIFKYGVPPHGGVGFGLDRITQKLLGLNNIREAVLVPRDTKRLTP
jgi:nondiscriminating aspartyl-tRNA synthetase